jgi:hypothetical protein
MKAILLAATLSLALVSTAHAQSFPAELTQLGIIAGMPYAKAKRLLDAAGWQASPAQGAPESLRAFRKSDARRAESSARQPSRRAGSRSRCGWALPWQGSRSCRALIERLRSRQR